MKGVSRFADRRIWLKNVLGFRILRIYFTDWRILKVQWITDFFNISAWIMDFLCFEVRIVELNHFQNCFFFYIFFLLKTSE